MHEQLNFIDLDITENIYNNIFQKSGKNKNDKKNDNNEDNNDNNKNNDIINNSNISNDWYIIKLIRKILEMKIFQLFYNILYLYILNIYFIIQV